VNLKTGVISYDKEHKLYELHHCVGHYPLVTHLTSNRVHIFNEEYNFTAILGDDKSLIQNTDFDITFFGFKPVYIPKSNELLIFGGRKVRTILVCKLNAETQENRKWREWKVAKLQMPRAASSHFYDVVLAFEHLVFVFYSSRFHSAIWILDIVTEKWFKSQHKVPIGSHTPHHSHIFKTADNMIHILDFYDGSHYKISLHQLIPPTLKKLYREKYDPLVIGYIKQKQNEKLIPTIPLVLQKLIWRYFPSFV